MRYTTTIPAASIAARRRSILRSGGRIVSSSPVGRDSYRIVHVDASHLAFR